MREVPWSTLLLVAAVPMLIPAVILGAVIRVNHGPARRALVVALVLIEAAAVIGLIIAGVRPV
ncbi:MAG: hypothetical protein QOF11_2686 [Chloroflexota bacterium]|jgi:hypothetical protein|nr:hypothetical protein [Chloroflexota bacterium]